MLPVGRIPEGDGVLVGLHDDRMQPACPQRGQAILGVAQEGLPEPAPSLLRSHREPVDGAAIRPIPR